jgi:alkanesulfonate monooxygenase SsuD/methylene tetrahydromethanopterin reductase-like flavin-dependent oxidoreductase (luciferase family)
MVGTGKRLDFGFGVFPYSYVSSAERAQLAKLGDALGYYAFTLPEHLLTPSWPQAPIFHQILYDTMVIESYIAAITTKVKLLTSVSVVPYHPPRRWPKRWPRWMWCPTGACCMASPVVG